MAYIAARVESEKQPLVQLATRTHPDAAGSPECSTAEALAGPDGGIVGRQHPQHMLPVRVTMGMLMCSAWIVAYSDRTNISLAIIAMEEDLGFDTQVDGMVFGAFFGGYVFTQILGGWSAGRWGGKRVLAFAVAMWSLWTALTPPAARSSVLALVVCRVMLGLGEGLALPALHHVTAQWSPAHERSRFVAFVTSGQHIGKAVALACSPLVALHWPVIFYLFATMGALWLLVWMRFAASSPAEHPTISDEERMLIAGTSARPPDRQDNESQQGQTSKDEPLVVPWVKICKEPAFIGAVLCHFGHNWANYFALSWLPKYLHEEVGVSLEQTGFVLILPYIAPVAGGNIGAQIADRLLQRGWSVVSVRRTMECISCGSSMLCLGYFAVQEQPSLMSFTVLTTIEGFFSTFSFSGYLTNLIDIGPSYAGALMGISNTVATLPGIAANLLAGEMLASTNGDWRPVFGTAVAVLFAGLVAFLALAQGHPVLVPSTDASLRAPKGSNEDQEE